MIILDVWKDGGLTILSVPNFLMTWTPKNQWHIGSTYWFGFYLDWKDRFMYARFCGIEISTQINKI